VQLDKNKPNQTLFMRELEKGKIKPKQTLFMRELEKGKINQTKPS
jgi:hypothetical protein